MNIFLVFIGGGLGSVARFLLSDHVQRAVISTFPWGTFMVNVIGCAFIGALWALSGKCALPFALSVFLFSGILGGFTTFSSFGIESWRLIYDGLWAVALTYVLATNIAGLLAAGGSFYLMAWLIK